MENSTGEMSPFVGIAIIVAISIGSWALARKYREEYGTTEMSRFRGFGMLFGLVVAAAGTIELCMYYFEPKSDPLFVHMMGCAAFIVGGVMLTVLCCMGILRRYSGGEAFAMILRLLVVGFATYMVAAWIMVALFFWMFAKLFPRKRYVVVEVD